MPTTDNSSGSTVNIQINGVDVLGKVVTAPPVTVRCPACGATAFRATLPLGVALVTIQVKCHRCNTIFEWP